MKEENHALSLFFYDIIKLDPLVGMNLDRRMYHILLVLRE